MRTNYVITFFLLLALSLYPLKVSGQVSSGSQPLTTLLGINPAFVTKSMPPVDVEQLMREDYIQSQGLVAKPMRYGTVFEVNYNLNNSGTWETLSDGSRIWRLGITSSNAISINLFFSDFYIPRGGQLFIYNSDKSMVLGAYTYLNNVPERQFAVQPTFGECTIIEYYEPVNIRNRSSLKISKVVHAYRDLFGYLSTDELACNININCPIGAPWVEQKRSVTRITFVQGSGSFLCSGSLVNNTAQDRKLYYLTAEHCAPDNHLTMTFYFNYEAASCNGTTGILNNTLSGATLKASNFDTDFRLVEINGSLPASYNAYFNGWDKSNTQPAREIAIHHPDGAVKKISVDTNQASTTTGFGGRLVNGFWLVVWDHGMTEGGSSGCPLYDQNHRVIGQNLGGTTSQCENPQAVLKYFGKFSESWGHGGAPTNQLKNWLDPSNSNVNTIDGIDAVTGIAPVTNFTSNFQSLPIGGGSVNFTDLTTNGATTWSWNFPGGTPSSSTSQNPTGIQYTQTGAYTVSLTTTNQFGSNTKTLVNYITVAGVPITSFSVVSPVNMTLITVGYNDPSTVQFMWNKAGNGPTVKYLFKIKKIGPYPEFVFQSDNNGLDTTASLSRHLLDSVATIMGYSGDSLRCTWRAAATNGLDTLNSSNTFIVTLRSTTIGITPIGSIVPDKFYLYNNYPNPFNPKTIITFDVPFAQTVKLKVFDLQGREVSTLVNHNLAAGRYNVDFDGANLASGVYLYSLDAGDFHKVNKMVLIK